MARPTVHALSDDLYASIGSGFTADDESNDWPLLRFIDAVVTGTGLDAIHDIVSDSDDGTGWSSVFDIDRTPDRLLPWIGQLVGVELPANITPADQRERIVNRENWERGTVATIRAAIAEQLTGDRTIYLTERDTSAYHFDVSTLIAETPDTVAVAAAINRHKPAGLQYSYSTVSSIPINALVGTIDAQTGTIDGLT